MILFLKETFSLEIISVSVKATRKENFLNDRFSATLKNMKNKRIKKAFGKIFEPINLPHDKLVNDFLSCASFLPWLFFHFSDFCKSELISYSPSSQFFAFFSDIYKFYFLCPRKSCSFSWDSRENPFQQRTRNPRWHSFDCLSFYSFPLCRLR